MVFILCTAILMNMAACSSKNVKEGTNSNDTTKTSAAVGNESSISSDETVQQATEDEKLSQSTEVSKPATDSDNAKSKPAADGNNAKQKPAVDSSNTKQKTAVDGSNVKQKTAADGSNTKQKTAADGNNAKPSPTNSPTKSIPNVNKSPESNGKTVSFDSEGVEIPMDGVWSTYYNNLMKNDSTFHIGTSDVYGVISISFVSDEGLNNPKKSNDSRASLSTNTRDLFNIYVYYKDKLPDIATVKEKANSKYVKKVNETNDLVYYLGWNDSSSDGLSDASKKKYEQLYKDIPKLSDKITFYTPAP